MALFYPPLIKISVLRDWGRQKIFTFKMLWAQKFDLIIIPLKSLSKIKFSTNNLIFKMAGDYFLSSNESVVIAFVRTGPKTCSWVTWRLSQGVSRISPTLLRYNAGKIRDRWKRNSRKRDAEIHRHVQRGRWLHLCPPNNPPPPAGFRIAGSGLLISSMFSLISVRRDG